jgi:hypothetical protein
MRMTTEKQWQEFLSPKSEEEQYLLQERAGIHESHGGLQRLEACWLVMHDYCSQIVCDQSKKAKAK